MCVCGTQEAFLRNHLYHLYLYHLHGLVRRDTRQPFFPVLYFFLSHIHSAKIQNKNAVCKFFSKKIVGGYKKLNFRMLAIG